MVSTKIQVICDSCGKKFERGKCNYPRTPRCGDCQEKFKIAKSSGLSISSTSTIGSIAELAVAIDLMRATLDQLREQRIKAGLTLRQAAKLLSLSPSALSAIEWGREKLTDVVAARMAETYGIDPQ